jgi:NSS family neurotransmitter:Na+ symporter
VEPIVFTVIFLLICAVIILPGVGKGIERVSRIVMPALLILVVGIAIYSLTLKNTNADGETVTGMQGLKILCVPDLDGLTFNKFMTTLMDALGQLFYSISVAMGIMITYGSYVQKKENIETAVTHIALFDTAIAFLAGLMIIPAVFAFSGGNKEALGAGPGLMFVTLPKVFDSMTGGAIIGAVFFVLVLFAALTSSISLMETVVSIFMDKFGWKRKTTCLLVLLLCIALGLPSCLGYGLLGNVKIIGMQFLDFFDFISNSIIMPIVALLTCILIGYVIKPKALIEEIELGGKFKRKMLFTVVIKYIAPVCIVLILFSSLFMSL